MRNAGGVNPNCRGIKGVGMQSGRLNMKRGKREIEDERTRRMRYHQGEASQFDLSFWRLDLSLSRLDLSLSLI